MYLPPSGTRRGTWPRAYRRECGRPTRLRWPIRCCGAPAFFARPSNPLCSRDQRPRPLGPAVTAIHNESQRRKMHPEWTSDTHATHLVKRRRARWQTHLSVESPLIYKCGFGLLIFSFGPFPLSAQERKKITPIGNPRTRSKGTHGVKCWTHSPNFD